MSKYYKAQRTRNIFDPNSNKPFKLSRAKLDLFLNCARCFYLDRRLGIGQPPGFPFNLNSAVDLLLKKEFDLYRAKGEPHPLMKRANIDAIPFHHEDLDAWRDSLRRGIQFHHQTSGFVVTGGVDDLWITRAGELIIVDYKATAKSGEVSIDSGWQIGYKRQMSLYAWLFEKNGFKIHEKGYFVYCNGRLDRPTFDSCLHFDIALIPYTIDSSWVERALVAAKACLQQSHPPQFTANCDFCSYLQAAHSPNLA